MAVDLHRLPTESLEAGNDRGEVVGVGEPRPLLQAVVIYDKCQVVEPELRRALPVDVDVDLRPAELQAVGDVDQTLDLAIL